jgi:hypothetical protein
VFSSLCATLNRFMRLLKAETIVTAFIRNHYALTVNAMGLGFGDDNLKIVSYVHSALRASNKTSPAVSVMVALGCLAALPCAPMAQPRAATGEPPNWTGIWERVGSITWEPNGRPGVPENPPFTPEYAEKYRRTTDAARQGHPVADPTSRCLPPGMPRIMTMSYPMELLMTPGQVTIIAEWSSQVRRIFTDGRGHPAADDLDPTYNDHSIGHWEGRGASASLVIDTVGIRADTGFDSSGIEHSDQVHVVERMRQTTPDMLEDEITVIDPKAFVHPWAVTKKYRRGPRPCRSWNTSAKRITATLWATLPSLEGGAVGAIGTLRQGEARVCFRGVGQCPPWRTSNMWLRLAGIGRDGAGSLTANLSRYAPVG